MDAAPVLDARELTNLVFREPRYLEELIRGLKLARRTQASPARDIFAIDAGPVGVHGERFPVPAMSHHVMTLARVPARMDIKIEDNRILKSAWPGIFCLVPAGCSSEWRVVEGVGHSVNLFLSPSVLGVVAAETVETDPARALLRPLLFSADEFLHQLGFVASKLDSGDLFDRLYLESLGHTVAMHLLEHYADLPWVPRPVRGRLPIKVLGQIADYVEEQPEGELTLARLASLARLSPYHFARLFKDTTGKTVHAYVVEQRLLRSRYLLLATRLPMAYIAMETGFADESHFVRSFKALFGFTPGMIRRNPS